MAALLALVAACSTPDKPATAKKPEDEQLIKYVQCLQQHGVHATVSLDPDGDSHLDVDTGPNDPAFVAGRQACKAVAPADMTKSLSPAEFDRLVKIADCMRKQGLDVKDPTADDPGLRMAGSVDDTEKARKIQQECEKTVGSPTG
jgi:hypothetical protein